MPVGFLDSVTRATKIQALHRPNLKDVGRLSFIVWDKFSSLKVCFPKADNRT